MGKWIAVSGYKYSGKDTYSQFFVDNGYTKVNFGDNLKQMLADAFFIGLDWFYDTALKEQELNKPITITTINIHRLNNWIKKTHMFELPLEPFLGKELITTRQIMQFVGTDMIRTTYNDYHVEATLLEMEKHEKLICSDVRFPNELEGMDNKAKEKGHDFFKVYVKRPGFLGDSHASETSITENTFMENGGIIVNNDTDIDSLQRLAKVLF